MKDIIVCLQTDLLFRLPSRYTYIEISYITHDYIWPLWSHSIYKTMLSQVALKVVPCKLCIQKRNSWLARIKSDEHARNRGSQWRTEVSKLFQLNQDQTTDEEQEASALILTVVASLQSKAQCEKQRIRPTRIAWPEYIASWLYWICSLSVPQMPPQCIFQEPRPICRLNPREFLFSRST